VKEGFVNTMFNDKKEHGTRNSVGSMRRFENIQKKNVFLSRRDMIFHATVSNDIFISPCPAGKKYLLNYESNTIP